MSKFIWCILGRSGSGKDTLLAELLTNYYPNRTKVISKTTRQKRFDGEDCHIFATEKELDTDRKLGEVVAYNHYAGNHYWATKTQIDNADFYIVDVPGLIQLKKDYDGDKKIKAIGLKVSAETSLDRMIKRGDSIEKAAARLDVDDEAFAGLERLCDICITADNLLPNEVAKIIADYIALAERV